MGSGRRCKLNFPEGSGAEPPTAVAFCCIECFQNASGRSIFWFFGQHCNECRVRTKISMIYINDIYHDIYLIFSSENIMIYINENIMINIMIFSKYHDICNWNIMIFSKYRDIFENSMIFWLKYHQQKYQIVFCYVFTFIMYFTAQCTLVQSAVLRSHVVCLSVRLSACDIGGLWSHGLEI